MKKTLLLLVVSLVFFFFSKKTTAQDPPKNSLAICDLLVNFIDTLYRYESGNHFGGYFLTNTFADRSQIANISGGDVDNFMNPSQQILPIGVGKCLRVGDKEAGASGAVVRIETFCLVEQISLFYRMVADQVENHEEGEYPYTKIRVMDANRTNFYCHEDFVFTLRKGEAGVFQSPSGKLYTNWRELKLNLKPFFGSKIIIEIETGDCSLGEHLGYCYFYFKCSDEFSPLSSNLPLSDIVQSPRVIIGCPSSTPITIRAKKGFGFYKWDTGETTDSIKVSQPGVYKVRVGENSANCQGIDSAVYYPDLAYLKILPRFYCPNSGITLRLVNLDPNSADSVKKVEWDVNDDGTFEHVGAVFDTIIKKPTWVAAKIITKKGCIFTMRRLITQIESPWLPSNLTVERISGTCLGNTTRIISGNYQQVNWDIGNDGTFDVIDKLQLFHRFSKAGQQLVRMRVIEKASGCFIDTVLSLTITEPAQPDILVNPLSTCMGQRIQFTSTFVNLPTRVEWDLDGDGYYDPRTRPVNFRPDTVFFFPGLREIGLRAFRGSTCIDTIRKVIEIGSFPFGAIAGDLNVCDHQPIGKYWPDTKFAVSKVDWQPTNGFVERTSGDTVWIAWLKSRPFHLLEATVTSDKGCSFKYSSVFVKIRPSVQTQKPLGETFVCADAPIRLYRVSPTLGYAYQWQVENGEILSGQGTDSVWVRWLSVGKGSISLAASQVIDTLCFSKSEVLQVEIAPAKDTLVELLRVSVESADGIDVFWNIEGEDKQTNVLINRDQTLIAQIPKSRGSYRDLTANLSRSQFYQIATSNLCADSIKSVSHQNIALNAQKDELEKTISLDWNPYVGWSVAPQYEVWSSQDNRTFEKLSTTDGTKISFSNGNDAFLHCFKIRALGENNLMSQSNTACVRFEHRVKIFEFLTPNGDGLNDRLTIESLSRYTENELKVFNRFGQVVYSKVQYDNNWAGDELQGTFFCVFRYKTPDGQWIQTSSALTILR
jgi:gliding motility-associated-like protein